MNFRFRRFLATTTLAVACAAAGSAWAGARDDLKTFTSGLKAWMASSASRCSTAAAR